MNMLEKIIVYDSFPRARRIAAQLLSNMVVNSPGGTKLLHLLKRIAENAHIDSQMRVYIKNAFNQLKEQKKKKNSRCHRKKDQSMNPIYTVRKATNRQRKKDIL